MHSTETQRKLHAIFNGSPVCTEDRIYALSLSGKTQQDVATACGVSGAAVRMTLCDKLYSYNVASGLSAMTGLPLNKLWPDGRYSKPPRRRPFGNAA